MAKKESAASVEGEDVQFETMPGADPVSQEEKDGFGLDLSFEGENENPEETDAVEETTEEDSTEETEVVAEEQEKPAIEEPEEESAEENNDGVDGEVGEEKPESEPELELEEKKKSPMVPKSRLDEVIAKQKALQKQLDEQTQKKAEVLTEAPEYDFNLKEGEYQQLVLDGESDKASQLRNEIRVAERSQMMFEVQQQMGQTVQQSQEVMNLQTAAKELETTYPILDENSKDYNEAIQKEVIDLRDAFVIQGYDAADALKKAANYTLAVQAPEALQSQEEPVVDNTKAQALTTKKKKATVQKKIEAANSQPPELQGESNSERGESNLDLTALSEDEFNALPDETLRRLRGDFG